MPRDPVADGLRENERPTVNGCGTARGIRFAGSWVEKRDDEEKRSDRCPQPDGGEGHAMLADRPGSEDEQRAEDGAHDEAGQRVREGDDRRRKKHVEEEGTRL